MSPRNLAPVQIGASNQIRLAVVTVHDAPWIVLSTWERRGVGWQEAGPPLSVPLGQAVGLATRILTVNIAAGKAT